MQNDPIADALVAIKNAERVGKGEVEISPASRLMGEILRVMQSQGYITGFEHVQEGPRSSFRVLLGGRLNDCGVIKPRHAFKKTDFQKWEARYLPAQDFGALIVTTTEGVMSHYEAKEKGTGGKLLAYVY